MSIIWEYHSLEDYEDDDRQEKLWRKQNPWRFRLEVACVVVTNLVLWACVIGTVWLVKVWGR